MYHYLSINRVWLIKILKCKVVLKKLKNSDEYAILLGNELRGDEG